MATALKETMFAEPKANGGKKLVVRLLADYWDAEGVRHNCAYIDEEGEPHLTGALVELPEAEARKVVKTEAAERGDSY